MKKRYLFIIIIFTLFTSFVFMESYQGAKSKKDEPKNVVEEPKCEYNHPSEPRCKLSIISLKGKWVASPSFIGQRCTTIEENGKKVKVKAMVPNSSSFIKNFAKRYKDKDQTCPSIYVNNKLGNCKDYDTKLIQSKCFMVYNKPGSNRTEIKGEYYEGETPIEAANRISTEKENYPKENPDPKKKYFTEALEALTTLQQDSDIERCDQLLSDEVLDIIKKVILIIRIAAPIVLIALSMLDFAKAIPSNNNDAIQKAITTSIKRFIAIILIFIVPTIIMFIMDILGISDGTCGL